MTKDNMPKELWVYNRNGNLEARDYSGVIGDTPYILKSDYDKLEAANKVMREKLEEFAGQKTSKELDMEPCSLSNGEDNIIIIIRKEAKAAIKAADEIMKEGKND